ncbi:MAG: hypothetical protein Unbinned4936contig1000_20 [Prokaryotic dsDNA virus sp.]|nr:MAG: hypothetical protein Unbinned4936contig1000_20 [Prokaryotic dsDNA virus sp.]|tara:strand:+ start:9482 stop:10087 length:606 start_codon:yes stop_codon:yes gene_type:complete
MPTRIEAASTTGLVKTTEKASKTVSFGSAANSGKVIQLNSSGNIPPNLLNPVADQFRLLSNQAIGTSEATLSGWERVDTAPQGTTSTGLTQSNGIFTFPSTGLYLVMAEIQFLRDSSNVDQIYGRIQAQTSGAMQTVAESFLGVTGTTPGELAGLTTLINVTDTTDNKVQLTVVADATGTSAVGATDRNKTCLTFLRVTGT